MSAKEVQLYGNFHLQPPYKGRYPVFWVIIPDKRKVAYGICGYKGKAFTLTSSSDYLTIGVVTDILINKKCEEAERCLCLDCKYNRTTPESFSKSKKLSLKRITKQWGRIIASVNSITLDAKEIREVFRKSTTSDISHSTPENNV